MRLAHWKVLTEAVSEVPENNNYNFCLTNDRKKCINQLLLPHNGFITLMWTEGVFYDSNDNISGGKHEIFEPEISG